MESGTSSGIALYYVYNATDHLSDLVQLATSNSVLFHTANMPMNKTSGKIYICHLLILLHHFNID